MVEGLAQKLEIFYLILQKALQSQYQDGLMTIQLKIIFQETFEIFGKQFVGLEVME